MKFIDTRLYTDKVQEDDESSDKATLYEKIPNGTYQALLLPTESTAKERMDCISDLYAAFTRESLSNTPDAQKKGFNTQDMLQRHVIFLGELGSLVGYFNNCTSWQEQRVIPYDNRELQRRLQRLMDLIK